MVITCDDLWREISNYLDGEVGAELQLAIDGHLRECKRCAAVFGGTRNVIELYGDERMQQVPSGFSSRLHQTLKSRLLPNRRHFLGWIVATAATSTEMLYQSMPLRAQAARQHPRRHPQRAPAVSGDPVLMRIVRPTLLTGRKRSSLKCIAGEFSTRLLRSASED